MNASNEQLSIIEHLKNYNLVIDACAGSGKTTTSLMIAKEYPELNILLLTYNAQLKIETRQKVDTQNIEVHSYHSFCVNYYNSKGYVDEIINQVIETKKEPYNSFNYQIIIIDEAQDMTPLLYKFVCKILSDNLKDTNKAIEQREKSEASAKIVVMGDPMQNIYKFKEADHRYIRFAQQMFKQYNKFPWKICTLSTTFRCPSTITDFVNYTMLGYHRMNAFHTSHVKPEYVICNPWGSYPKYIIKKLLKQYHPSDIFVLAPSIKASNSPPKNLANYITNHIPEVQIFITNNDDIQIDQKIIKDKLIFSSIHQAKGRERKVVILFGFDSSYFTYFDKNESLNRKICPNEFYVATTRASERLILIHNEKNQYLPFLNKNTLLKYTNYSYKKIPESDDYGHQFSTNFTVTELVSYLPFSTESECLKMLNIQKIQNSETKIDIPSIVEFQYTKNKKGFETISEISGIAIPAYFEYYTTKNISFIDRNLIEERIRLIDGNNKRQLKTLEKLSKTFKKYHEKHIKPIDLNHLNINQLLKISLYYSAQKNNTEYQLKQITSFNWLKSCKLKEGMLRIKKQIGTKNLIFEKTIEKEVGEVKIIGQIDCIDQENKIVYEFKCTDNITASHILQLAIYMYLFDLEGYKYRLFNILTNDIREIEFKNNFKPQILVQTLINTKTIHKSDKSDQEFIKSNLKFEN